MTDTSPRPDRDSPRSTRRAPRVLPARALALAGALVAAGLAASVALPPPNIERAVAAQRELLAQEETAERSNDLGNLLLLADDPEGARAAYERAIELDETLVSAHYNLGLLLQQLGRESSATPASTSRLTGAGGGAGAAVRWGATLPSSTARRRRWYISP